MIIQAGITAKSIYPIVEGSMPGIVGAFWSMASERDASLTK